MTAMAKRVFDPEALERWFRTDPERALDALAVALSRGDVTVRLRGLDGVGSNDPVREHFHLSLDLGVLVVSAGPASPALDAGEPHCLTAADMENLLAGRGLPEGRLR